jgi:hypothetical protein
VVVRLDEIYGLRLADDKSFIMRILPLVSGSLLTFLGSCLGAKKLGGAQVATLAGVLPHFVRERLIRDLFSTFKVKVNPYARTHRRFSVPLVFSNMRLVSRNWWTESL